MRDEINGIQFYDSVYQIQSLVLKFLIEQSPLLPKTVLKQLQKDYDVLRVNSVEKYIHSKTPSHKVPCSFKNFIYILNYDKTTFAWEVYIFFMCFFFKKTVNMFSKLFMTNANVNSPKRWQSIQNVSGNQKLYKRASACVHVLISALSKKL